MRTAPCGRLLRDRRHARLLARARAGDEAAFRGLYRELFVPVSRYLSGRLERREDAEDLVSQVFHRFLERLDDFDRRRGTVLAWLLTMAHNALVDHYRTRKETVPVDELAELLAGGGASPLAEALRDERDRVIRGLLRELPAEIRRMFALRFEQDLRYREIAACMGLTESAVKQRFSRALRDLKSRLKYRTGENCEVDDVL